MKNNYGNFVVQKALKLSSGQNKLKLISCIVKNIEKIGDRKIILKWKSIVESHICPENEILIQNLTGINNVNNVNNPIFLNNFPQMLNYSAPMQHPNNNMYPSQNIPISNMFNKSNVNLNFNCMTQNVCPDANYNVNNLSSGLIGLNSNSFYNNSQSKLSMEKNNCMNRMNNYSFGGGHPNLPGSPNYLPSSPNNSFNFVNNQPNVLQMKYLMEKQCNEFNNKNTQRRSAPSEKIVTNNLNMDFRTSYSLLNKNNNNNNK